MACRQLEEVEETNNLLVMLTGVGGARCGLEGKDRNGDRLGLSLSRPWMAPIIKVARGDN